MPLDDELPPLFSSDSEHVRDTLRRREERIVEAIRRDLSFKVPDVEQTDEPLDLDLLPPTQGMAVPVRPNPPAPGLPYFFTSVKEDFGELTSRSFRAVFAVSALMFAGLLVPSNLLLVLLTLLFLLRALYRFFAETAPWGELIRCMLTGPVLWCLTQLPSLTVGSVLAQVIWMFVAFLMLAVWADLIAAHYIETNLNTPDDPALPSDDVDKLRLLWRERWIVPFWTHRRRATACEKRARDFDAQGKTPEATLLRFTAERLRDISIYPLGYLCFPLLYFLAYILATSTVPRFFQPMATLFAFSIYVWVVGLSWSGRKGLHCVVRAHHAWFIPPPSACPTR